MTSAHAVLTQFEADLRDQILSSLPHELADRPALSAMPLPELLVRHLNWISRYVADRPRRVHLSSAIIGKRPLSDADQDNALNEIVSMLEAGSDITAHLSRGISMGVDLRPVKSKAKRRDLDLMLNDWGVHHLHLSRRPEADGFVARTGPVLFAAFQPDHAYLIDIVDHGSKNPDTWTTQNILRIMAREWPTAGLLFELPGVLPSGSPWSDADRRTLRASGMATSIEIDGKVFIPRYGLSTAGTSSMVTGRVMNMMRHLRSMADDIARGSGEVWDALRRANARPGLAPDFHARVYLEGYGLAEEASKTFIWMGRW